MSAMRTLEAIVLYGLFPLGPVLVFLLLATPAPLHVLGNPKRPRWLRLVGAAIAAGLLGAGILLFLRWLFFVDLANRADHQFVLLLLAGGVLAWRGGLGRHAIRVVLRLWLRSDRSARVPIAVASALSGDRRRLPVLQRVGRVWAGLRGAPWRIDAELLSEVERYMRRDEGRVIQAVTNRRAGARRILARARHLRDRCLAYMECVERFTKEGLRSLAADVDQHPMRRLLACVASLLKAEEVSGRDGFTSSILDAWSRHLEATIDEAKLTDANPNRYAFAVHAATRGEAVDAGALYRAQIERDLERASEAASPPQEDLARWLVGMALLRGRYVAWAYEVACGSATEPRPQVIAWLLQVALERLACDLDGTLGFEREQMRALYIRSLVEARVPALWRSASAR